MATHSYIGILHENDSVDAVYCHYDGYLAGNGVILYDHYNSLEKAKELISKGSFGSLKKDINDIEYYKDKDSNHSNYYFHKLLLKREVREQNYIYLFHEKDNQWYVGNKWNIDGNLLEDELRKANLLIHNVESFKCMTVSFTDYCALEDELQKENESNLLFYLHFQSRPFNISNDGGTVSVLLQENKDEYYFNKYVQEVKKFLENKYSLVEFENNALHSSGELENINMNDVLEEFRIDCPEYKELTEPISPTI